MVGDHDAQESLEDGAKRELREETGYSGGQIEYLFNGPSSAGMTSEILSFYLAHGLRKVEEVGVCCSAVLFRGVNVC